MPPRIKFVVMSSGESDHVLAQLISALAPMPVLIHQDASRPRPNAAALHRPGVRWVSATRQTGWGDWGFASAILHSMADALDHTPFDYLQLLSPSCLPIRPLADLIEHVRSSPADYHADLFELSRDRDTRMNFAWRALAPTASLRQRSLLRLRRWYFGARPLLEQTRSMSLFHRRVPAHGLAGAAAGAAVAVTGLVPDGTRRTGPFATGLLQRGECAVGSVWFGARREVCLRMLELARNADAERVFRPLSMVDELLVPTLLMRAGQLRGPSNHVVAPFDLEGHPARLDMPLLMKAADSGRFFARKFAPAADDPCRAQALRWAGCDEDCGHLARADRNAAAFDPALLMGQQNEQEQHDGQAHPQAQRARGVSGAPPIAHHEEQR
jgi:hypothetical protein